MYVHYFLDKSLKILKSNGYIRGGGQPPKLPLGYNVHDVAPDISQEIESLIHKNDVFSCVFANETPIYNLGFFEQQVNDHRALDIAWKEEAVAIQSAALLQPEDDK